MSDTPITDDIRSLEFAVLSLHGSIQSIALEAQAARYNHSVKGHHCELRSALDSISDRMPNAFEELRQVSRRYNNFQLNAMADLERKLAAATAENERLNRDAERFRKLSLECYWPDDHPLDQLIVLVPEKYVPEAFFLSRGVVSLGREHPAAVLAAFLGWHDAGTLRALGVGRYGLVLAVGHGSLSFVLWLASVNAAQISSIPPNQG